MLFHHYFWAVDVILYRDGETLKQAPHNILAETGARLQGFLFRCGKFADSLKLPALI